MSNEVVIRVTKQSDLPSLQTLYHEAFYVENLFPLVVELLSDKQEALNLSAVKDGALIGHIAFTQCHASPENISLALLGPIAVLRKYQRQGIGSLMIKTGFNILKKRGVNKILVLGDPNYYGHIGFTEETSIRPPYSIPEKWKRAWQSITITDYSVSPSGQLKVTKAWQRQELWSE